MPPLRIESLAIVCVSLPQQIVGTGDHIKRLYFDGPPELAAASRFLKWRRDVSSPHQPQSNRMAERVTRRDRAPLRFVTTRCVARSSSIPISNSSDRSPTAFLTGTKRARGAARSRRGTSHVDEASVAPRIAG